MKRDTLKKYMDTMAWTTTDLAELLGVPVEEAKSWLRIDGFIPPPCAALVVLMAEGLLDAADYGFAMDVAKAN